MRFIPMTEVRQQGVGAKSGRAYDFRIVQGLVETKRGREMAEVMLDKDHPTLDFGQVHELEIEFYPDREKRLAMKVIGMRPAKKAS